MRLLLLTLFVSSTVLAYDFPLLQKTLGGLDKEDGVVLTKSCQIFDDHSKIKADDVIALIKKAEKEPLQKFVHVRRQVPSVEIWANYPEKFAVGPAATGLRAKKVLLLKDSSSGEHRNGPASDALLKIVESTCVEE